LVVPVRVSGIALAGDGEEPGGASTVLEGVREVAGHPRPRLLVSLLTAQYVVVGSLDVLFVVVAIQVLGKGQGWVGYLNTAYGAGALAAGILTAHLMGRRLGRVVAAAVAALGTGLILIAFFDAVGVVVGLLALVGAGQAVLVIAAHTMLQRVVAAQVVGRVFGMVHGRAGARGRAHPAAHPRRRLPARAGRGRLPAPGHGADRDQDPAPPRRGPHRPDRRGRAAALAAALRRPARARAGD